VTVEIESPPPRLSKPQRRFSRRVLLISIGLHLLFAVGATFFVVSRYVAGHKLTFAAGPKSPNPAERALQHRVQVQQKLRTTSAPPAVPKRVLTRGAAKVQLPALPTLPVSPASPSPLMSGAGQSRGFLAGLPSMASIGATGTGAAINFFGIRDISNNVVIVVDISDSMFGRTGDADYKSHKLVKHGREQSFQAVRDEAIKLVEGLTPAVSFGIVRFSGGAYSWKPELVPATDKNKKAAIEHIQKELDYHKAPKRRGQPGGTRHDYAFEEAFKLKPEGGVIYLLTDGNATGKSSIDPGRQITPQDIYKVVEEGEKTLRKPAKIHTIYYVTGADREDERQMLQTLANRFGGKFMQVDAPGRKR
jgi:von Willebrand factor type A domain